jgi:hypothetical protein
MKTTIRVCLLACFALILGCKTKQSTNQNTGSEKAKVDKVIIDENTNMADYGSAYNLDSVSIAGKTVSVFVSYSGGCKEHVFKAYSNKLYSKSLPPQVGICVKHETADDNCRKLVMQELKFDISSVLMDNYSEVVIKVGDKKVTCKK